MDLTELTKLLSTNASAVPAYFAACYRSVFQVWVLNDPVVYRTETSNNKKSCHERLIEYVQTSANNYFILKDEVWANVQSVSSSLAENTYVDPKTLACRSGIRGVMRYIFTIPKSKSRIIDLPVVRVSTTSYIPYRCVPNG